MRHALASTLLALFVLHAGGPAAAEEAKEKTLGERLDQAVKKLDRAVDGAVDGLDAGMRDALRSVERFIDEVPGYEAPEVTPEGDIIIRKKRPEPALKPAPTDERQV